MIPLTILYDEYVDRPKLTEQKKNPVEYIVPPSPLKWGSKKKCMQQNQLFLLNIYLVLIIF